MDVTRSMTKKKNQDKCSKKRAKTLDNSRSAVWSSLIDEILFLIIMRLGLADFDSFSSVCKRWRSAAFSSRKMFLESRQPMSLSFSLVAYKKYYYLEDLQNRKSKTIVPHSNGRTCVGSTCGYVILYGTRAYDFWLVNLITRHELHFPRCPIDTENLRGILVFSPSMSGWVFVVSRGLSNILSICLPGKEACWYHLWLESPIHDIHFFNGKIYMLNAGSQLFEVRLNPKPTLKLLGIKILNSELVRPELASWGENMYVIGYTSDNVYKAMEVDFDQMKLGCPFKTTEKYVCFVNMLKSGGAGKVGLWAEPRERYERFGCFHGNDKVDRKDRFDSNMWYFTHDCFNVNRLQE